MSRRNPTRNTSTRQPRQPRQLEVGQPSNVPPMTTSLGIHYQKNEHRIKHESIVTRKLKPTKFYDEGIAERLGVENDVKQIFYSTGVPFWLEMHALTYKRLTVEFLSSLYVHRDNNNAPRYMTFQLMDHEHRMTIEQVNRCFRWPVGKRFGPKDKPSRNYQAGSFWRKITGLFVRDPRSDKATAIIHPAFRLAHRLIANTIFARGDSAGVVSNRELLFLWHLCEGDDRLDLGAWLVDHLEDVAKGKGGIAIGGMITLIATFLEVDFSGLEALPGSTRIDLATIKNMQWVEQGRGNTLIWYVSGARYADLPNPMNTVIYDASNWIFESDYNWQPGGVDDEEEEEEGEDQPQTQHHQEQPHQPHGQHQEEQPHSHHFQGEQSFQEAFQQQQGFQFGEPEVGTSSFSYEQYFHQMNTNFQMMNSNFQNLQTEFGEVRRSNETMTTAFTQMRESFEGLRGDLGEFRNAYRQFYPGGSSPHDPNQ